MATYSIKLTNHTQASPRLQQAIKSGLQDLFNQAVNAEAFLYDESMPARAKALMMLFKPRFIFGDKPQALFAAPAGSSQ